MQPSYPELIVLKGYYNEFEILDCNYEHKIRTELLHQYNNNFPTRKHFVKIFFDNC